MKNIELASQMIIAVNHPKREEIIELLENKIELNVTQIQNEINIVQAATSHHLSILRNVGIVYNRREGKSIVYGVDDEIMLKIRTFLHAL